MPKISTKQVIGVLGALALNILASVIWDQVKDEQSSNRFAEVAFYSVWIITAVILLAAVRAIAKNPTMGQGERPFSMTGRGGRFMNSILGAIIAGVLLSTAVTNLWLLPIWTAKHYFIVGVFNYEIGSFATLAVLGCAFIRKQRDSLALLAFAVAIGIGAAGSIMIRRAGQNYFWPTTIGWLCGAGVVVIVGLFVTGPIGKAVSVVRSTILTPR